MNDTHTANEMCPFCGILNGREPGTIIYQDTAQQFALIQSIHPEGAIHWLAVPFEHVGSTEELEAQNRDRFLNLLNFATTQTRAQTANFPLLQNGFTIKFHLGAYETVPHAKLHILSTE
jgi:diadenosine tetraphosphate (Ap4A) HIT family hydrolase